MKVKINELTCILIKNALNEGTRRSMIWLEMIYSLTKDHIIHISFTEQDNEIILDFIFVANGIESYCLLKPNFEEISFAQLINKQLNGFHIVEANNELKTQILNR